MTNDSTPAPLVDMGAEMVTIDAFVHWANGMGLDVTESDSPDRMFEHDQTELCYLAVEEVATVPAAAPIEAEPVTLSKKAARGVSALRWLLNITTEFDRKDVRTRQAARLLDEFHSCDGTTNREKLEALWSELHTDAVVEAMDLDDRSEQ